MLSKLFLACTVLLLVEGKTLKSLQPKITPRHYHPKLSHQRIINGTEVNPPNVYNYQVALFIDLHSQTGFCGGSLITRRYVLTAGHCVAGARYVEVIFGAHRVNTIESTQTRMISYEYTIHSEFIIFFGLNDIALIKLPTEVELTDAIGIVNLPSLADADRTFEGDTARLTGWGMTTDNSVISDVLRETKTEIISNDECLEHFFVIQPSHICSDCSRHYCPCNGDSGGALLVDDVQVGVVSFGSGGGCSDSLPAGYSRITYFLKWIAENSDLVLH